jgi:hypothetical protein
MSPLVELAASIIADSARLSLGYARRMMEGIPESDFACFAKPGGETVISNHPAFVYGHLGLYASRILRELGHDAAAYEPTAAYAELFSPSAQCQDDPERKIYPPMDEILDRFFPGYEAALAAIEQATADQLAAENPNEKMRSKFATLGGMHGFYVGGHMMIHMGQVSAWRRMMGLGAA